jgi:hypothetical protein
MVSTITTRPPKAIPCKVSSPAPPGGAVSPPQGGRIVCVRENKIYRQALCLVEICLVSVLTSNNKQHILSPANVIKVCYSLGELYVKSVYLNLFGWSGA